MNKAWKINSRNFTQLGLYSFTGSAPPFTPIATYMDVTLVWSGCKPKGTFIGGYAVAKGTVLIIYVAMGMNGGAEPVNEYNPS